MLLYYEQVPLCCVWIKVFLFFFKWSLFTEGEHFLVSCLQKCAWHWKWRNLKVRKDWVYPLFYYFTKDFWPGWYNLLIFYSCFTFSFAPQTEFQISWNRVCFLSLLWKFLTLNMLFWNGFSVIQVIFRVLISVRWEHRFKKKTFFRFIA